jgi:hypothetical protein
MVKKLVCTFVFRQVYILIVLSFSFSIIKENTFPVCGLSSDKNLHTTRYDIGGFEPGNKITP